MAVTFDAVVLAGGRGSRLGGVAKPEVTVGGRRMVDIALAAVSGAGRAVVVGDVAVPQGVLVTREDPPFGGPVAGLEAGVRALGEGAAAWTVVLASDLPDAEAAVAALLEHVPAQHDGVCLLDADGRLQWLLGCYRTEALRRRLAERGDPPVTAMYRLLEPLDLLGVQPSGASVDDLDTPEDAARWSATKGRVEW